MALAGATEYKIGRSALPPTKSIVFVVDDDISVRESLELLIRTADWHPELFASAQAFLDHPPVSVPNCLVLDLSDTGVRIETAVMIDAPETAFLQIQDDMIGPMTRRWTAGNQIGFEFTPKK